MILDPDPEEVAFERLCKDPVEKTNDGHKHTQNSCSSAVASLSRYTPLIGYACANIPSACKVVASDEVVLSSSTHKHASAGQLMAPNDLSHGDAPAFKHRAGAFGDVQATHRHEAVSRFTTFIWIGFVPRARIAVRPDGLASINASNFAGPKRWDAA